MEKSKKKNGGLIARFLPYYRKYAWIMALDLLCASLTVVCEIVFPLIVRYVADLAQNDMARLTVSLILTVGGVYLALRVIDTAANYFMQDIGHVMGAKMETDMRSDLFRHLEKLSFNYYDDTKVGQIMARMTSDLFDITEFAHHCPEEFFIAFLKIGVSFAILCTFNVYLTLIIFAFIPIMLVCSMYFRKKMRSAFMKSRHQRGEINARVEDSLLGIRVVKSFANEDVEERKFEEGNERFLEIKKETYKYMAGFNSVTRIFEGVMYVAVIVCGSLFLLKGKIELGEFIAYLLYIATLLTSIRRIIDFTEQFQNGMTGIERFYEIMDAPVDIEDKEGAIELTDVRGTIEFREVSFKYNDGADVLNKLDLRIEEGENVAVVGPSGGGKTTLCNLIPRFYEANEGSVTVDGIDVRDVTLESLRRNIGMVQQDVYLFSGTIYENIAYGRKDATREEIERAARDAGAYGFISRLEKGFDTYVGERGVKLSGGQKQRISIARVFLKDPPILILDEATSALDNESERLVQRSLEKLAKGRTTLTIAHRLSTIRNASRIIVLTDKGIAESGTHDELLAAKGVYYSLYTIYSGEKITDDGRDSMR